MLHINPYDVIGVNPNKELQELTDAVEQNWDMPGEKIANIDYGERQAFVQDGFHKHFHEQHASMAVIIGS